MTDIWAELWKLSGCHQVKGGGILRDKTKINTGGGVKWCSYYYN